MQWFLVFALTLCADFVWAEWSRAVTAKNGHVAGLWGAATVVCAGLMAIAVTNDPWMIVPGALGAYVGTRVSVKRGA